MASELAPSQGIIHTTDICMSKDEIHEFKSSVDYPLLLLIIITTDTQYQNRQYKNGAGLIHQVRSVCCRFAH